MIKLKEYCVGVKPKDRMELILANDAVIKTDEHLLILLIPESVVDELKKGVIGEWE